MTGSAAKPQPDPHEQALDAGRRMRLADRLLAVGDDEREQLQHVLSQWQRAPQQAEDELAQLLNPTRTRPGDAPAWSSVAAGSVGPLPDWLSYPQAYTVSFASAAAVLGPAAAARILLNAPTLITEEATILVLLASRRGRRWVEPFLCHLLDRRQRDPSGAAGVYAVARPLCDEFELPTPTQASFTLGWLNQGHDQPSDQPSDELAGDPRLGDLWLQVLTHGLTREVEDFAGSTLRHVAAGSLDRDAVVEHSRALLAQSPAPTTQQAIAAVLEGLGATATELGPLPFLLDCLASGTAVLNRVLVPHCLALLDSADDVLDVAAAVAATSHKQVQRAFVRSLADGSFDARFGVDVVRAGLACFTGDEADAKLRAEAHAVLRSMPTADPVGRVEPTVSGLWDLTFDRETPWPPAGDAWPPLPAALARYPTGSSPDQPPLTVETMQRRLRDELRPDRAVRDWYEWPVPMCDPEGEGILENLTRRAWLDPAGVRAELRALVEEAARLPVNDEPGNSANEWHFGVGLWGSAMREWASAGHRDRWSMAHALAAGEPRNRSGAGSAWTKLLVLETLFRLGSCDELLSAASQPNASIDFDVFVDRLSRWRGSVGPVDLAVALLRLGPQPGARLDRLDGIRVPIDHVQGWPGAASCDQDAAQAARQFLRRWRHWPTFRRGPQPGGGDHLYWIPEPLPPFPIELPAALLEPTALSASQVSGTNTRLTATWAESVYSYELSPARADHFTAVGARQVRLRTRHAGIATFDAVLALLASPLSRQPEPARVLATLFSQPFDHALFVQAACLRADEGVLNARGVASGAERLLRIGGLRTLWSPLLEVAADLVARQPITSGASDLLAVLADVVHEVPEPMIPAAVRDLAESRSRTKTADEARTLVARAAAAGR